MRFPGWSANPLPRWPPACSRPPLRARASTSGCDPSARSGKANSTPRARTHERLGPGWLAPRGQDLVASVRAGGMAAAINNCS
eukprot:13836465-Alexandrium_andersonii.AAC.1